MMLDDNGENTAFRYWFKDNIDKLRIKWAENGADRELDFNEADEVDKEYDKYQKQNKKEK